MSNIYEFSDCFGFVMGDVKTIVSISELKFHYEDADGWESSAAKVAIRGQEAKQTSNIGFWMDGWVDGGLIV